MSSMVGIINLVIFLGITITVLLLLSKGLKQVHFTSSVKNNSWILGGYIVILLCSMVVFFLMPNAERLEWKSEADLESGFLVYEKLMNKEDIEERYVLSKERYDLSGKEVEIISQDNYSNGYQIMFEKSPDLEGEIEVIIYKGILTIEQLDISDELPSPSITFSNGKLEVGNPAYFEKRMAYTAPEFPFAQFSGQRSNTQGYAHSSSNPIIYIKVPEEVIVNWDQEYMIIPEVE